MSLSPATESTPGTGTHAFASRSETTAKSTPVTGSTASVFAGDAYLGAVAFAVGIDAPSTTLASAYDSAFAGQSDPDGCTSMDPARALDHRIRLVVGKAGGFLAAVVVVAGGWIYCSWYCIVIKNWFLSTRSEPLGAT